MAKKIPPAFQCYASDWLGSTRIALMLPEQEGAYFRLLCHAWADDDCSLPADERQLAVLSRLGPRWKRLRAEVMACFEPHPTRPDRIVNHRLYAVRQEQDAHSERMSEAGAIGANARWHRHGKRSAIASEPQSDRNAARDAINMRRDSSPSPTPTPTLSGYSASSGDLSSEAIILPPEKQSESAKPPPPAACVELAGRLRDRILEFKPDARLPAKCDGWANTFRLMIERDQRSVERITRVIDWATAEPFWQPNILSADKLREKFDVLEGQMRRRYAKPLDRSRTAAEVSMESVRELLGDHET